MILYNTKGYVIILMNNTELKKDFVYKKIKEDIFAGKYPDGRLPKEEELAVAFNFSRVTIRPALDKLEKEGLIVRMRSKGTFIKQRDTKELGKKILILLDMNQKNDISWPSNYIIPGIESAAKGVAKTEIYPLEFINELGLDAGVKFLKNASIHGTVIFGGRCTGRENYIQMLQRLGKPVVMAGSYPGDVEVTGFAAVRTEFGNAWNDGIRYLKSKGHQRIATITYPLMRGYDDNMELYREFLRKENVYHPEFIKMANTDYESVKNAVLGLLRVEHTPTAVMCYSDFYAIHVLRAAKEYGLKVPENLAVMGYCGFPGGAYLDPSLSTVDFHYFEIGETVMEMLNESDGWFNVKNVSVPDIIYPYEIIERKSTQTLRVEGSFL